MNPVLLPVGLFVIAWASGKAADALDHRSVLLAFLCTVISLLAGFGAVFTFAVVFVDLTTNP